MDRQNRNFFASGQAALADDARRTQQARQSAVRLDQLRQQKAAMDQTEAAAEQEAIAQVAAVNPHQEVAVQAAVAEAQQHMEAVQRGRAEARAILEGVGASAELLEQLQQQAPAPAASAVPAAPAAPTAPAPPTAAQQLAIEITQTTEHLRRQKAEQLSRRSQASTMLQQLMEQQQKQMDLLMEGLVAVAEFDATDDSKEAEPEVRNFLDFHPFIILCFYFYDCVRGGLFSSLYDLCCSVPSEHRG